MDQARQLLQQRQWSQLKQLIDNAPRAQALHIQAAMHLAQGLPQQALQVIRQSLELESSFSQRNTLAVCLLQAGQATLAAEVLSELLQEQPDNPDLWFNLARAQSNQPEAAVQALQKASQLRPGWRAAELMQISLLSALDRGPEALSIVRRNLAQESDYLLEAQLVFQMGRYQDAARLCLGLLEQFNECLAARALLIQSLLACNQVPQDQRIADQIERGLGLPGALALVPALWRFFPERESLLVALLENDLVTDFELEKWLTAWRREFRFQPHQAHHPQDPQEEHNPQSAPPPAYSPLARALALHNFTNEFSFVETPEEIADLHPDHPAYPLYRPLPPGQAADPAVIQRHLQEPAQEKQWQSMFSPPTPDDAVARQYQQNPYPRWRSLERLGPGRPFQQEIQALYPGVPVPEFHPLRLLVAGCGTGRHALLCAQRFSDAEVWALDFSPASLAYAQRQSQLLGVSGVHFLAGDLLALDKVALPQHFEVIESLGVLHHLPEPEQGLQALLARLSPAGWMRLGYYSRRARQPLEPARQLARGWAPTRLRELRAHLIERLPPKDLQFLTGIKDFYSLSGLRDLLLHEREQEYDLPQLGQILQRYGLHFVGFDGLAPAVLHGFIRRFGRSQLSDLTCWQQFEEDNPTTFLGMYVFWCCRR